MIEPDGSTCGALHVTLAGDRAEELADRFAAILEESGERTFSRAAPAVLTQTWFLPPDCEFRPPAHDGALSVLDLDSVCDSCPVALVARVRIGDPAPGVRELYTSSVTAPDCPSAFERAQEALRANDMTWRDVVRTWIHLTDIERDYDELNRVRAEHFDRAGLSASSPFPASTGVGGSPRRGDARCSISLHAMAGESRPRVSALRSPTFNEAHEYDSLFARGLRLESAGGRELHVSGTASIDASGATVGSGDFDAQVRQTVSNLEGCLRHGGASFGDAVEVIAYLKRASDRDRFRELIADGPLSEVPLVVVRAEICRPELLCEIELLARC